MEQALELGQVVRKPRGWSPMVVIGVMGELAAARYVSNSDHHAAEKNNPGYFRTYSPCYKPWDKGPVLDWASKNGKSVDYWLPETIAVNPELMVGCYHCEHETTDTEAKGNTTMTTLYETNENPSRYGTLLAINSHGQYVLEIRGTGEVAVFDKSAVSEVMPYTVLLRYLDGTGRITVHASIRESAQLSVGDVLVGVIATPTEAAGDLSKASIFTVVKLDTKNRNPKGEFHGRVLKSTAI